MEEEEARPYPYDWASAPAAVYHAGAPAAAADARAGNGGILKTVAWSASTPRCGISNSTLLMGLEAGMRVRAMQERGRAGAADERGG